MDALLGGATLHGANFRGANLFGADLARIRVDTATSFEDANLKRARIQPKARP